MSEIKRSILPRLAATIFGVPADRTILDHLPRMMIEHQIESFQLFVDPLNSGAPYHFFEMRRAGTFHAYSHEDVEVAVAATLLRSTGAFSTEKLGKLLEDEKTAKPEGLVG